MAAAAAAARARQAARRTYTDPEAAVDLRGQAQTAADRMLMGVYGGDTVHQNDGRHLHDGVANDAETCWMYDQVVSHPHSLYSPPLKGPIGRRFIYGLRDEWKKCRERKTNSETPLIYTACILRKDRGVTGARAIKRRIERRLDQWERGEIASLVQDVVTTARQGQGGKTRGDDDEVARRFASMVNSGKMRAAVRMATDREGGGPLQPWDIDAKTGKTVLEVLRDKHPEMMIPDVTAPGWLSFESYDDVPAEMMVDCDQEIVQGVAGKLRGGAGPSPVDGLTLGK